MSGVVTAEGVKLPGLPPLTAGVEVTVAGIGRCRFVRAEVDAAGAVDVLEVFELGVGLRSVAVDRVREVHRGLRLSVAPQPVGVRPPVADDGQAVAS